MLHWLSMLYFSSLLIGAILLIRAMLRKDREEVLSALEERS